MLSHLNNARITEARKLLAENVVVINGIGDFPNQTASIIFLEPGNTYAVGSNLVSEKRFVVRSESAASSESFDAISVVGTSPLIVWAYTGTGVMFTGVDVVLFFVDNFGFRCTNADEVFNIRDLNTLNRSSFIMSNSFGFSDGPLVKISNKFGTFINLDRIEINTCSASQGAGVPDGITVGGTSNNSLVIEDLNIEGLDSSGIGLDFGTTVINTESRVGNLSLDGAVGSVGISGAAASANMAAGVIGTFQNNTFGSNMTPLSGVSESDLRLEFRTSAPVPNSSKTADSFLSASQTVTITTAGVFVAIAGTNWLSDVEERFSTTTAGLVTYLSPISTQSQVAITATVEKVGGGTDEIELVIAINGSTVAKTISGTKNKDPTSLTSIGVFTLTTNDTIQAFVANIDSTANIVVSRSSANIINGF